MVTYIIRRLMLVPLLLFGVSILIFAMLQFLDPVERASLYIRGDFKSDAQVDAAINRYCLNCPIYQQYLRWLVGTINPVSAEREGGILFGNFGWSRTTSQPVAQLIARRFPNTLDLTLWAVGPVILVGIWLGVQAAVHHNGLIDQAARVFSIIGTSFPTFVVGLMLLMLFYATLEWVEPGRISNEFSREDRKSTRLNSSHLVISYAV